MTNIMWTKKDQEVPVFTGKICKMGVGIFHNVMTA